MCPLANKDADMKSWIIAFVLSLLALPALAASCTIPNGSIAVVYANAAGTCVYQPYATISNATTTAFITWCEANYIATPAAATAQGCFNTWANDWFNQTVVKMTASAAATASASAVAAVVPPAIVPAQ